MENEVKVETKKKGNGFFTLFACIMTGIIVFLAINIGQKASKTVDPDTPKKNEVTSNVESNTTTSNTPVETKLSDAEALTLGKDLYMKAYKIYPNPLSTMAGTKCKSLGENAEGLEVFDCTEAYNELKNIFTTNNEIFSKFKVSDGKYILEFGGIGYIGSNTTTLAIKSNESDKIVFTATTVNLTPIDEVKNETKTTTGEFILVKENGTWKISVYNFIPADKVA